MIGSNEALDARKEKALCARLIRHYNPVARTRAAIALAELDAADELVAGLNHADARVRRAACDGISLYRNFFREGKQGLGSAYLRGFSWGLERGYDYLLEMDSDHSHDPKYLPDLLRAVADGGELDLVIGSRYVSGVNVINWPMSRLLLSWFVNKYARVITGLPLSDSTAGFKCFRREVLEAIDFDKVGSTGYAFQIEMDFRAWKKGYRVGEVPIVFVDREEGESKMSGTIVREAVWRVWALRFRSLFGRL